MLDKILAEFATVTPQPTATTLFSINPFFKGFNFETLLSTISCIVGIVSLFVGGAAYKQCRILKKSLNDKKEFHDNSQDNSQKSAGDINNYGMTPTELTTFSTTLLSVNSENFTHALNQAYETFSLQNAENLKYIVQEAERIVKEAKMQIAGYSKLDWINIYFESAKLASDKYMQDVWAKILAKELSCPGSFSCKTLDLLKSMSADDFILFEKLCSIIWDDFILQGDIAESRISWSEQLQMRELGLINLNSSKRWYSIPSNAKTIIPMCGNSFILSVSNTEDKDNKFEFSTYFITTAAKELLQIASYQYDFSYFFDAAEKLKKSSQKHFIISLHQVTRIAGETMFYQEKDLLKKEIA